MHAHALTIGAASFGGGGAAAGIPLGSIAADARHVIFGDSYVNNGANLQLASHLMMTAQGSLYFGPGSVLGYPGETVDQFLANRLNAVIQVAPEVLYFMDGGLNNLIAGVGSPNDTGAWIVARLKDCWTTLLAALPNLIIFAPIFPITGNISSAPGGSQYAEYQNYVAGMQASTSFHPRVIIVDPRTGLATTNNINNVADAAGFYDGIHPNAELAKNYAYNVWALTAPYYSAASKAIFANLTGNIHNRTAMTGTTGTIGTGAAAAGGTGTLPTGFTVSTDFTGVTVQCETITFEGNNAIRLTGSGTVTGANATNGGSLTVVHSLVSTRQEGDFVQQLARARMRASDGSSSIVGLRGYGESYGQAQFQDTVGQGSSSANRPIAGKYLTSFDGVESTSQVQPWQNSGASANQTFYFDFYNELVDFEIIISQPKLRVVEAVAYATPVVLSVPTTSAPAATVGNSVSRTGIGRWSGGGVTPSYIWARYDSSGVFVTDIAGATGTSYTYASADIGFKVGRKITVTNSFGSAVGNSTLSAVIS